MIAEMHYLAIIRKITPYSHYVAQYGHHTQAYPNLIFLLHNKDVYC